MTETKALAVINNQTYIALTDQINPAEIGKVISDNTGGKGLTARDLDVVKIPSGGGLAWELPSLEGPKPVPMIEGIIIYFRDARAYWAHPFEGASNPPDCVSPDAVTGIGNPGGSCADCELALFGPDGEAQACKQIKQLFVLDPESWLPLMVQLAPTSLTPIRHYFLSLLKRQLSYYSVVTRLRLEKAQSRSGITYSRVKPEYVCELEPAQRARLEEYTAAIRPYLAQTPVAPQPDGLGIE